MDQVSRRRFLAALGAAVPAAIVPTRLAASGAASRALTFHHLHTGEHLTAEYYARGAYVPGALAEIDRHLRDFRTGEVHAIDPALLDLLHRLSEATGTRRPFEVISGFRSPKTNQTLRARSTGVAASSLHMVGKAIDVRLADIPLARLHAAALGLRAGGVGYYPGPRFVHVDTGRVRTW